MIKANQFKNILDDISEKFDTLIEGQNLLNEKLDRHSDENKKEFKEVRSDLFILKKDVWKVRKDLNEYRENTELHLNKKKKKAS